MSVNVDVDIDLTGLNKRFSKAAQKRAQKLLAKRILKSANVYCPKDTGALQDSATVVEDGGAVLWPMCYAKKVYYSNHVRTSVNPYARTHWVDYAKSKHLKEWVQVAKKALE